MHGHAYWKIPEVPELQIPQYSTVFHSIPYGVCFWEVLLHYCTHLTLCPPFLPIGFSYKYGGAYIWRMVFIVSLMRPLSLLCSTRGEQQWQNCLSQSRAACDEARSGAVLQDKQSWNCQWRRRVCVVRKRDAVSAPPPAIYESAAA